MESNSDLTQIEEGCVQCLHYFGLFKYPLNTREIHIFNAVKSSLEDVEDAVGRLLEKGKIFSYEQFYMNEDEPGWAKERIAGNYRAAHWLAKASPYVKVVSSFPFVRCVTISGSLSKNYADDNPDIDYFIITEVNRLWIARTLLHLFKKLTFVTGHQHYFCMNYFIDTEALTLEQKNQYTAIELATLLPAYNLGLTKKLMDKNAWFSEFLPNHPVDLKTDYLVPETNQPIKRFFEQVLNSLSPEKLNRRLMKITDRKWRKKWRHASYTPEEYNQAMLTEIHVSKNHPDNYEKAVLDGLMEKGPQKIAK